MIKKLLVITVAVLLLATAGLTAAEVTNAKKGMQDISSDSINLDESLNVNIGDYNVDPKNIQKALDTDLKMTDQIVIGPGISQSIADVKDTGIGAPETRREIPLGYIVDKKKMEELKRQIPAPITIPETAPQPNAPTLVRNFEGIKQTQWMPPDPHIAAGPNHIGLVVNSRFEFYNKAGTSLGGNDFGIWYNTICPGCFIFDPRIVYDFYEGHWLMMTATFNSAKQESWYLLSVSKTADPLGGWWLYKLPGAIVYNNVNTFADYPDIGFDGILSKNGGAVYITSNQFNFPGTAFETAMLSIVNKSDLYTGGAAVSRRFVGFKDADGSMSTTLRAAVTLGNPNNLEFLINTKWNGGSAVTVWQADPVASTVVRRSTVATTPYSLPPDARQPCPSKLDTIDNRMFNAVYKQGRLYAGFNDKSSANEGILHYLRINLATNTAEKDIKYGEPGHDVWFPAVGVDVNNNVTIVYARSAPNEFAGIRYTGHKAAEAGLQASALLKAGQACYTGGRWGDYFGASIDPSAPRAVWIYGEWAKTSSDWGTWVGVTTFP